jgi:hypothetical protein
MQEAFGPYPGDEFMWVLEGEVCMIDGDNQVTRIREGQSFCLRNGIPVSWKQNGFLRKYYMRYDNPALPRPQIDSAVGGVVVLGDGQYHDRLAPMDNSDPFVIAGEAPQQRNYTVFTNDSENLFVGIWDTTAFDSEMRPFPCHEMAQVLEGAISIEEAQGPVHRFVAGDAFFVPMGTECRWYCDGYVKKYYSILDPG